MFDHLEPKRHKRVELHHHISLSFLMASALSLGVIFALPLISFTQSVRPESTITSTASMWLDPHFTQAQSIVVPQKDFEAARYVLKITDKPAKLLSLHFTLNGVGELTKLSPVRLYLDEVQVGEGQVLTPQGDLTYHLVSDLKPGIHSIALHTGWATASQGQLMQISLLDAGDITLVQNDQTVTLTSVLPLTTKELSLADRGALLAVSGSPIESAAISANQQGDLVFQLNATGEPIDVTRMSFRVATKDFSLSEIQLLNGDKLVRSWKDSTEFFNQIDLVTGVGAITVTPGTITKLNIRLIGQASQAGASVEARLSSMTGLGFVSGQEIKWQSGTTLVKKQNFVRDQISWSLVDQSDQYILKPTSSSAKPITIYQAVVEIQSDQQTVLDNWQVLLDGRVVSLEVPLVQLTKAILRFPQGLVVQSGQTLRILPITNTHGSANIRLIPDQLQWQSSSTDWIAVADDQVMTIPATRIRW